MTPVFPPPLLTRGARRRVSLLALGLTCLLPVAAAAQQEVMGGMTWMTQFPATWNAGAPKVVSDGLHFYAVFCGVDGSPSNCSIAKKRGDGIEAWTFGNHTFTSNQPAITIIDRKGRLNIFYNNPQLRHIRFDHPSVNLTEVVQVPVSFSAPVGYLHASYDAKDDIIMLAFNETTSWTMYFGSKNTDTNGWVFSALPAAGTGKMFLYARSLRAGGQYRVLAGEHVVSGPNFSYTGAILFESPGPSGPWTQRVLHRVTGNNLGVPYGNWVLANDLQADASGHVRAMLHITELGSGHAAPLDGLYLLREEDGYVPHLIDSGIEDGFTLYVDPSGVHLAFARNQIQVSPFVSQPGIVWYRSDDAGVTWTRSPTGYPRKINPVHVDSRNGSMLGPDDLFLASGENPGLGAYDSVIFGGASLGLPISATRYDYEYLDDDGTWDYLRAYTDVESGRSYYYIYDYDPDLSFSVSYSYTTGSYYQVYIADSDGSVRYYNSDGYEYTNANGPRVTEYWYDDTRDGTRDYLYLYKDRSADILWWAIYDFDTQGNWNLTYVYYRGTYWYIEFRSSNGHFTRYDSTGFQESG